MQIIGYKHVEFKNNDGEIVNGFTVYVIEEINSKHSYEGFCCEKIFLSKQKFDDLNILELYHDEINFTPLYNRYGKIEKVIPM